MESIERFRFSSSQSRRNKNRHLQQKIRFFLSAREQQIGAVQRLDSKDREVGRKTRSNKIMKTKFGYLPHRKGRKETKLTRDCAFAPWWTMSLMTTTTTAAWVFSLFSLSDTAAGEQEREGLISAKNQGLYQTDGFTRRAGAHFTHTHPLGLPSTIPCPMDRFQSPLFYIHLLDPEIAIATLIMITDPDSLCAHQVAPCFYCLGMSLCPPSTSLFRFLIVVCVHCQLTSINNIWQCSTFHDSLPNGANGISRIKRSWFHCPTTFA